MSSYRLFLVREAVEFLLGLRRTDRQFLEKRLELIRQLPSASAEYHFRDTAGRRIDGCVAGRFAIEYWEDGADMDLKIMRIAWSDGRARRT